jgi:hypothetical protein
MPKISEVHRGGRETLDMPGLPRLQEVLRVWPIRPLTTHVLCKVFGPMVVVRSLIRQNLKDHPSGIDAIVKGIL